jgi:chromosome segregation ATPase
MATTLQKLFAAEGIDNTTLGILISTVERNNRPEFDYIEFKQAVQKLIEMQLDEPMAFKSAFATASTLGLTREKLIETATHYRSLLESERSKFDEVLQKQQEKNIAGRIEEAKALKDKIVDWQEEINKLQQQIAQAKLRIDENDLAINQSVQKINNAKALFDTTLQHVNTVIAADIQKISEFL